MVADLLEKSENGLDEEHAIKWAAASMYSGERIEHSLMHEFRPDTTSRRG